MIWLSAYFGKFTLSMTPLRFLQTIFCYDVQPWPLIIYKVMDKQNSPTKSLVHCLLSWWMRICINWDEHIYMVLYVYCTTFKVTTRQTSFQLVYWLYLLMPTTYMLSTSNSNLDQNCFPSHILTSHMVELEQMDETH